MKYLLIATIAILTTSCATVLTGLHDDIYFNIQPEGAKIYINGINEAVGSKEISVRRSYNKKHVTIKKEGYEDANFVLEKKFNAVALLDFIGLYWFIVDIPTAAVVKYSKSYYDIELEKKPESKK